MTLNLRWGDRFVAAKDVPWHRHAETEIVAVTKGHCRIKVGKEVLDGERGAVFILPANEPQYQETLGVTRTTYIGFELPPGLFDERARVLKLAIADPALRWIEELCDHRLAQPPLSPEVTQALLLALLRRLGDFDVATGSQARWHPAVRLARDYLQGHLTQPVTLSEAARAARVSASHLSALFAAECGIAPMQYLQGLRLEHACWLLANPYLRIHEIAEASGYEDVNYFTRLFRQRFGVSPGGWRRRRVTKARSAGSG